MCIYIHVYYATCMIMYDTCSYTICISSEIYGGIFAWKIRVDFYIFFTDSLFFYSQNLINIL